MFIITLNSIQFNFVAIIMRTLEIATNSLASKLKTKQSKQNKNQPQMRKANKLDTFSLTINNTRIVYSRNNQ